MLTSISNPFIKKFETTKSKYIYDVNTNKIIKVNPLMFEMVDKLNGHSKEYFIDKLEGHGTKKGISAAFDRLVFAQNNNKMFSCNRPSAMGHGYCDEHFNRFIDTCLGQLTLEITTSCNLRCRYCAFSGKYEYTRKHGNDNMSEEIARKAIDYYVDHSKKAERHSIGFYGGEPLLNIDLIKHFIIILCKD